MGGDLQDSIAALSEMKAILTDLRDSTIFVISAYMKVAGLQELLGHVGPSNSVRILVRWQPNDLLMGASDLCSYGYAIEKNWTFYARQDLHAKVYALGEKAIFIGSANLTSKGFSLAGYGNAEIMVRVRHSEANVAQVASLFSSAVQITDDLANDIQTWIAAQPVEKINQQAFEWPLNLAKALIPQTRVTRLMISECFTTDGSDIFHARSGHVDQDIAVDLSLLALPISAGTAVSHEVLIKTFTGTKMFRWLIQTLEEQPNRELYFGSATALLHDALLDDPRPYRQSVKFFLSNLLSWIFLCPNCGVIVDQPRHSQRMRLLP